MDKQDILTNILLEYSNNSQFEKKQICEIIDTEINSIIIEILAKIKINIINQPIQSYNINTINDKDKLPYDYLMLKQYCPDATEIIISETKKRQMNKLNDEMKTKYKILLKQNIKLKKQMEDLQKKFSQLSHKYDTHSKIINNTNFKSKLEYLREIKRKYEIIK
jgi:hypothetical protein